MEGRALSEDIIEQLGEMINASVRATKVAPGPVIVSALLKARHATKLRSKSFHYRLHLMVSNGGFFGL
jgi:hypothetical protein